MPKLTEVFLIREDRKRRWAEDPDVGKKGYVPHGPKPGYYDKDDPQVWGGLSPNSKPALVKYLTKHDEVADIPTQIPGEMQSEAEWAMYVDDMEGLGLREAIEEGDMKLADHLTDQILKKFPPGRWSAFGNGFEGDEPEGGGNSAN